MSKDILLDNIVFFTERNIHAAWVVYGAIGVRQYYGYSKKEAEARYIDEYNRTVVNNS